MRDPITSNALSSLTLQNTYSLRATIWLQGALYPLFRLSQIFCCSLTKRKKEPTWNANGENVLGKRLEIDFATAARCCERDKAHKSSTNQERDEMYLYLWFERGRLALSYMRQISVSWGCSRAFLSYEQCQPSASRFCLGKVTPICWRSHGFVHPAAIMALNLDTQVLVFSYPSSEDLSRTVHFPNKIVQTSLTLQWFVSSKSFFDMEFKSILFDIIPANVLLISFLETHAFCSDKNMRYNIWHM